MWENLFSSVASVVKDPSDRIGIPERNLFDRFGEFFNDIHQLHDGNPINSTSKKEEEKKKKRRQKR